ncbi:hypothetical protein CEXT_693381 [Caerostris extrusa]|uniref:Uncharacterized protein n=1 Tax=Caerostris extrusa TaxID=172846 RepID=A0AAV4XPI7_CAEEX|nr:hypothetical protein CEXT_693381 [Caerostris extrusa]
MTEQKINLESEVGEETVKIKHLFHFPKNSSDDCSVAMLIRKTASKRNTGIEEQQRILDAYFVSLLEIRI